MIADIEDPDYDINAWLHKHDIYDAVDPLEALVRVQPTVLRSVLKMALMIGIHAGAKQQAIGRRYADIEREMTSRMGPRW